MQYNSLFELFFYTLNFSLSSVYELITLKLIFLTIDRKSQINKNYITSIRLKQSSFIYVFLDLKEKLQIIT